LYRYTLEVGSDEAGGALHAVAAAAARGFACSRRREETAIDALRRGLDALRNAVRFYDEGFEAPAAAAGPAGLSERPGGLAGMSPIKAAPPPGGKKFRAAAEAAMVDMQALLDAARARALGQATGEEEDGEDAGEGGGGGSGGRETAGGEDDDDTFSFGTGAGAGGASLAGNKHDRRGGLKLAKQLSMDKQS
jgi:hypothetical protein